MQKWARWFRIYYRQLLVEYQTKAMELGRMILCSGEEVKPLGIID